jgi:hypothetical protein
MATITTLNSADSGAVSRTVLNTNLANLNTDKIETSYLDTDVTLAADSDAKVATQKATKSYVDNFTAISTSGVSAGPSASSTQTITHGLGKAPTIIRVNGIGTHISSGISAYPSQSFGTYNSTGNRCTYIHQAASGSNNPATSTTFAVILGIGIATTNATGVIQNVTATDFDIVWTATGSLAAGQFIWEAQ